MSDKPFVASSHLTDYLDLIGASILVDKDDFVGIHHADRALAEDFGRVAKGNASPLRAITANQAEPFIDAPRKTAIIIGCIDSCWIIKHLERSGKIDTRSILGKWESSITAVVKTPLEECENALVIAGSDKRGAIFGAYTLSSQIGVSLWYWRADVPAKHHPEIYALPTTTTHGEPSIQYRGIFINDEAPALTGWVLEKFGGYNSRFYKKVYELLLRLKANFMWPAMWPGYPNPGAVFFTADPENQRITDEYGICVSTSHHEPLQRATTEWFENGRVDGTWNRTTHREEIIEFFRGGVNRAKGLESSLSVFVANMIVKWQLMILRALFEEVHGREDAVPQVMALYKEIQDLYQAGDFTVPDDVTLLFADDNFGSLRRLPSGSEKSRKGGAGIYYHFEYVGAPRSYEWINSKSLLFEAHRRNARKIWVFNIGDIKPIEVPLTFAMQLAWDVESISADTIIELLGGTASSYFGEELSQDTSAIWHEYDRLVRIRKHEHIDLDSFSLLHYNEADDIVSRWQFLEISVDAVYQRVPTEQKAAFWELVVHSVKASTIFTRLRVAQGRNQLYARQRRNTANKLLREILDLFDADFKLSQKFHSLLDGKWNHMLCQPHLGYGDTWHAPSRDAIFGLAYVQGYRNSNLIVGQMGIAVEGHEGIRAGRINEESERTHPSRRDLLSVTEGMLDPDGDDARVWISILWGQVPVRFDQRVLITISSKEGDYEHVHLPIRGHRVPESFRVFVEADGRISIPAYGMGIKPPYHHHPELGRGSEGAVTVGICDPLKGNEAPFLENPVYIFSHSSSSTVILYFNMTLEIDPAQRMSYEIGIDDQLAKFHNLLADPGQNKGKILAEGWSDAAMDCVWKREHSVTGLGIGVHIIRVRLNHTNVVLEKIVLDLGGVKESYLGPPKSFCASG
ncbi:hypothetical protein N7508_006650 [Penicillium antarcticum]|uniref:uncharacterized protein n=1 Tax=Penicillium antarcticum TaxID=416450 RepID=UPI00239745D7|nr:uncharacterized protein N7508_006650 [Penicillium antarcticum]KAJ5301787.1 hypothetical protein N7508_006650 [Penicillium antarcticum]